MLKKRIPYLLLLISLVCYSTKSYSQDYKGAVGARFGYGIGITGLYMFNQRGGHGLEFLLRYGYHGLILNRPGINIQVLYEKHWAFGRGSWTGYVGGGPAIGFGKKSQLSKIVYFAFGISPIVGIDFTTSQLRVPLVLSLDYKPTFNADFAFAGATKKPGIDFSYYEIAFSVRIGIR